MDAVYGTGDTTFPKENPVESRKELINQKERQLENGSIIPEQLIHLLWLSETSLSEKYLSIQD